MVKMILRDFETICQSPLMALLYEEQPLDGKNNTRKGIYAGKCRKGECKINQQPLINMKETEEAYYIYANLPGVPKDRIRLDFDERERLLRLSVPTLHSEEPSEQGSETTSVKDQCMTERWLLQELPDYLSEGCERKIELPKDASAEDASGTFVDGVLQVRIPRQRPRKHQIHLA